MEPGEAVSVDLLVDRLIEEPGLWPELLALGDRQRFADALAVLAVGWRIEATADDVLAALTRRRREWLERWV
jgi:hypothetical protein